MAIRIRLMASSDTLLAKERYIAALRRDGAAAIAAASENLAAPVPSCPGWDAHRLIGHLGRVYCSVREHVARRASEVVPADEIPKPPEGEAVLAWCEEALDNVASALEGIEADEPVWSWAGDPYQNGGFYHRRMAHETLIHRWDAENAVGEPQPLDDDLAADNIDELLQVVLPFTIANWQREIPEGTLHLHRIGGEGEWTAAPDGSTISVSLEHAKGDAAVRGPAADLALFVWERKGIDDLDLEVFGSRELAERWAALSR